MASSLQVKSRSFTIPLYRRALLDEVGLSGLLDAANKREWHNITRPEALAAQARAASFFGKAELFNDGTTQPETARDPPLKGGRFAPIRAASGFSAQVAAKRPSAVTKGAASSTSRAAGASDSVAASRPATCKPESRRNLKPTKPAIQISDADRS